MLPDEEFAAICRRLADPYHGQRETIPVDSTAAAYRRRARAAREDGRVLAAEVKRLRAVNSELCAEVARLHREGHDAD